MGFETSSLKINSHNIYRYANTEIDLNVETTMLNVSIIPGNIMWATFYDNSIG